MWLPGHTFLLWAVCFPRSFAAFPDPHDLTHPTVFFDSTAAGDIGAARQIVKDAIADMTLLNKARLASPARNHFKLKPGTRVSKREENTAPPLLEITDRIAQAAALVAELDDGALSNSTASAALLRKRTGAFWKESIARQGTVPWGQDR